MKTFLTIYAFIAAFQAGWICSEDLNSITREVWWKKILFLVLLIIAPILSVWDVLRMLWEDVIYDKCIVYLQIRFWWQFYFTDKFRNMKEEQLKINNERAVASFIKRNPNNKFGLWMLKRCITAINKRHNYEPK